MDTLSLRLFVLTCETLNISAAGRALGMAPAVASARIAKLEQFVGTDLLYRSTRKLSLSSEGQDFLPYAQEIVDQEDAALAALGKGKAQVRGRLRFATSSSFAQQYIAPLLPQFMDMYPNLILDLHFSDNQQDLIAGSYDLALRNSILTDSNLTARKLADDTRILCASPDYLVRFGVPLRPSDLTSHRLIAFGDTKPRALCTNNAPHTDPLESQSDGAFAPLHAASYLIINDGASQRILTCNGAGISINSEWSIRDELTSGRLVRVLPEYRMRDQPALWLIYPKSNVVSAKVRVLIDFLISKLKNLSQDTA